MDATASGSEHAELIFGIVAAVGTPIRFVTNILEQALEKREYVPRVLHLSSYTKAVQLDTPWPGDGADAYTRISSLMKRGNELRERAERGDILAVFAAAEMNTVREAASVSATSGRAFILRQLKHPDEIYALRRIYGDGFHTIGVYCPKKVRRSYLIRHEGMHPEQADDLIARDENERPMLGQKFRDTFYLSDVFISTTSDDPADTEDQVERFLDLLFGSKVISPRKDEYGMYLAHAAALRSSSLARQVGASVLSAHGDVLALGTEQPDDRDHVRGIDASDAIKTDIVSEILELLDCGWSALTPAEQQSRVAGSLRKLKTARIMNLTEFTRAVHAEMEALSAALRIGVSVRNAICVEEGSDTTFKVKFEPFVGIAPRRYTDLFSTTTRDGLRIRRKDSAGRVIEGQLQLRISMTDTTYVEREAEAARELKEFIGEPDHGTEEDR
jgi:deoxycytidylate deaminase